MQSLIQKHQARVDYLRANPKDNKSIHPSKHNRKAAHHQK